MKRALTIVTLFLSVLISVSCTPQKLSSDYNTSGSSSQSDVTSKDNVAVSTENTTTIDSTGEPSITDMIKAAEDYPASYPKFSATCNNSRISWIRGNANFTGKADVMIGNTNFGADDKIAVQALKATDLNPSSVVELKADEVAGLDKPKYKVLIFNKSKKSDQLVLYPSTQNQLIVPKEAGEYLFICNVDWGKGDNEIDYWFKINISAK